MSREKETVFVLQFFVYIYIYITIHRIERVTIDIDRSNTRGPSSNYAIIARIYIYIYIYRRYVDGWVRRARCCFSREDSRGSAVPARGTMPRDNKHRKKLLEERRETIHHPTGSFPRWPGFLVPRITRIGCDTSAYPSFSRSKHARPTNKFEFFETSSRWLDSRYDIASQNEVYRNGREIVSCVGN